MRMYQFVLWLVMLLILVASIGCAEFKDFEDWLKDSVFDDEPDKPVVQPSQPDHNVPPVVEPNVPNTPTVEPLAFSISGLPAMVDGQQVGRIATGVYWVVGPVQATGYASVGTYVSDWEAMVGMYHDHPVGQGVYVLYHDDTVVRYPVFVVGSVPDISRYGSTMEAVLRADGVGLVW